jgi:hypothetical protein
MKYILYRSGKNIQTRLKINGPRASSTSKAKIVKLGTKTKKEILMSAE